MRPGGLRVERLASRRRTVALQGAPKWCGQPDTNAFDGVEPQIDPALPQPEADLLGVDLDGRIDPGGNVVAFDREKWDVYQAVVRYAGKLDAQATRTKAQDRKTPAT